MAGAVEDMFANYRESFIAIRGKVNIFSEIRNVEIDDNLATDAIDF